MAFSLHVVRLISRTDALRGDRSGAMTEASDEILALAAEFPPASRDAWRKLVDQVLKGAPFERALVGRTYDGLTIEPLQEGARDARPIAGRAGGRGWQVLQRVDHPDPAAANLEARHDCENGATGLALVFAGSIGAYDYGIDARDGAIARVLDGIDLDRTAIELDPGPHAEMVARAMLSLLRKRAIAPSAADIRFGFDPIGTMAASGGAPLGPAETTAQLGALVARLAQADCRGPLAAADGRAIHNAGGTEAQELAFVLAAAVLYLRALEAAGIALDAARRLLFFRLSADTDQFLTIAKFRALRRLWARVEGACGLAPLPPFVSAATAWRTMTQRDPYTNMLRATIAVFAAGVGGADAITVLPFTLARGLPDRFARRMARNTQLILLQESNLARVADPSAGSGSIEALTASLSGAAWTLFQEIERAGGADAALAQGLIQAKVASARERRAAAIASRSDTLTGATDFPDLAEAPISILNVAPVAAASPRLAVTIAPLPRIRLAEPFERLRDASDQMLAATGSRPGIFLANLGTPVDFTARATFAKNFFETGGIAAAKLDGIATRDAMLAAFKASGATLACLCGSDEIYAREAIPAATALKQAGAAHIYCAGRPGASEPQLRQAGIDTFVYAGCNALAILQAAHEMIAAPRRPKS
jgi:methylmalonyl-CoA mutase